MPQALCLNLWLSASNNFITHLCSHWFKLPSFCDKNWVYGASEVRMRTIGFLVYKADGFVSLKFATAA